MIRSLLALLALPVAAAAKPNVLIVMTDDQGLGDFSALGNPVLKTPNLDRFATEAVRFTDFHACPMCTPTRGQLLTGKHAMRTGATSVTAGRSFLREGTPTLPEMFARAGYKTGLFGKWHLGDHYPHRPTDRGFQEAKYHLGWGLLHAAPEFDNPLIDGRLFHNGKPEKFAGHCTDVWFDAATAWMRDRKAAGEPFVCYLPTNAPHAPHVELPEFVAPYQGKGPAGFFGMIAHVDHCFGKLDAFLKDSGLRDDTVVVFTTDNGGTAGVPVFNAGLRAGKTTYYDGGHRVPCWVRWPAGKLGDPRDIDVPTQNVDLLPTLLELCGVKAESAFDGTSLTGLLLGSRPELPDRKFVVQYSRDKVAKWDSCVIWGRWRLVHGKELYDVAADRAQAKDVAAANPDVVKAMRDHYEAWWDGVEPSVNDYVPVAHLGSAQEPEVALTSADWEGVYADNSGQVRNAVGGPRGSHWNVLVAAPGEYEVTLRRWPRESGAALGAKYDATPELAKVGGKNYAPPSKAFPTIASAAVECAGRLAITNTKPDAQEVSVRLTLPAGRTKLQGWFRDAAGADLCGAFYAYVRWMP